MKRGRGGRSIKGPPCRAPCPPAWPAVGEKMRTLLVDMKKAHPGQDDALKTCWQTLLKMCGNIYANPGGGRRWCCCDPKLRLP